MRILEVGRGLKLGAEHRERLGIPKRATDLVVLGVVATVKNQGPDAAVNATLRFEAPVVPANSARLWRVTKCAEEGNDREQGSATPATIDCGTVERGGLRVPVAMFFIWGPGRLELGGAISSDVRDPVPSDNQARLARVVADLPDAGRTRIVLEEDAVVLQGGARNASAVHVAVAVGGSGGRAAATGCRWLRRPSGGLVKGPGACDTPRWLKAKGTTSWRLALSRRLPEGHYAAYVRARRRGHAEVSFDGRDGNLLRFRIAHRD
jgi:hypothetical protein